LGRLSSLSLWWIEQGIEVDFTRPASPQDNGSHERMHRDLKAEAIQPPSANLAAQQRRFERWRHNYNHERPHESLAQLPPAESYQPSERRLGESDKPMVYAAEFKVKVISVSGHLAHAGRNYHVGDAFDAEGGSFRPAAYVAPLRPAPEPNRPPSAAEKAGREQAPSPAPSLNISLFKPVISSL